MTLPATAGEPFALTAPQQDHLRARLRDGVLTARRRGRALAWLTVSVPGATDPSAVVCASRRRAEPWFCFEQPERGGAALAGLGAATELTAEGPDRFLTVARAWRELLGAAQPGAPDRPRGSGPVALGGFAFAEEGARSPAWTGFQPASLVVPEISLARADGDAALTICAVVSPDDDADATLERLVGRVAALVHAPLPLIDPDPTERSRVSSVMPPEHFEAAVAGGVQRIRTGELEKVVLAREVRVDAARPHDPGAVLGVLREAFGSCFCFCVGRGDSTFLAASPELLVRREGLRASTMALAGSTRRSADPAVDDHLGEQLMRSDKERAEHAIVARRIQRALRPVSVWVAAAEEPTLVRVANIQHLATPIRAQLVEPVGVLDLAARLHPTPAVGGEPWEQARPLIPALEGMDRGWYAGPVGWVDAHEDGEFCVALRCALLRGTVARCYAGGGVVGDSDPARELAETEVKLAALLPVLAG